MGSKTFLEYLAKLREGSKAIQSTNRDRDGPTRKAEREKSVEESLLNTFRLSLLLGARRPVTDTVDDLQPYARRQYDELKDQLAEMTLEQKTEKLKELKMQVESRLDESEQDRVMEREAFFPSLSSFPDKPAKPIRKQVVREGCWTLPELLSAGECKELIGLAEKKKFEIAESFCHLYANRRNDRMVSQDVSLAAAIYNRTKASLPPTITLKDGSKWEVQGINPHLRFCKYYPGHYFGAHLDGMYTRDEKCKSLLTIMIYLNDQSKTAPDSKVEQDDGFTGGSTWFLDSNYKPKLEVKPEAGLGIIFYQDHSDLLHEGSLLLSGVKYILRSDVMYRLVSPARATSQSEDTDSQQSSSSDRDSQQQQQTPAVHHSSRTQTRAVVVAVVVLVAAVLVSQLTRK